MEEGLKMPSGRLTEYTPVIAKEICDRIAAGESLRKICAPENFPSASTVCGWVIDNREGFAEQYAKARQLQAQLLADELFDIADDTSKDWIVKPDGTETPNGEVVGRSRLRLDTRKWYLSKVLPKIYGEKVTQEISGPDGGPIPVSRIELVALTK